MNPGALWTSLPYIFTGPVTRAVRVLVYGAIPVIALFVTDGNADTFLIGLRIALSAAILALIDKGQREVRIARAAADLTSGAAEEPSDGAIGAH